MHPDVCDDAVDRVIKGRLYGKSWIRDVRNAQQHLKSKGKIRYDNASKMWFLNS